jgi:hypothetical protein
MNGVMGADNPAAAPSMRPGVRLPTDRAPAHVASSSARNFSTAAASRIPSM